MVVYWEYAFAENFLLDGLLLYLAVCVARARTRVWRIALGAALGGAEAVLFPLLSVPLWCAYILKFAGGLLLCLVAVHKGSFRTNIFVCGAFFLLTFALGGCLTAIYSFFGVEYAEGQGYLIESAPVGLVFSAAGIFAAVCVWGMRKFYAYRKVKQNIFECALISEKREVHWKGFADSGNCLSFRGEPVCVVSAAAVFALFGRNPECAGHVDLKTVNGTRRAPVFRCPKMKVTHGKGVSEFEGVYLAAADVASKDYQLILHIAFTEERNEHFYRLKIVAAKDKRK